MFSPPDVACVRKAETADCSTSFIVFWRSFAFTSRRFWRWHGMQRGPSVPSLLALKCSSSAGRVIPQLLQTFSAI